VTDWDEVSADYSLMRQSLLNHRHTTASMSTSAGEYNKSRIKCCSKVESRKKDKDSIRSSYIIDDSAIMKKLPKPAPMNSDFIDGASNSNDSDKDDDDLAM